MLTTVTITKTLDDTWAEPGQLDALSDTEILSLVKEDIVEFVDGACWSVERDKPVSVLSPLTLTSDGWE
jgi:hypothetical protein